MGTAEYEVNKRRFSFFFIHLVWQQIQRTPCVLMLRVYPVWQTQATVTAGLATFNLTHLTDYLHSRSLPAYCEWSLVSSLRPSDRRRWAHSLEFLLEENILIMYFKVAQLLFKDRFTANYITIITRILGRILRHILGCDAVSFGRYTRQKRAIFKKKYRQRKYEVTLRCVRTTIVAAENKLVSHISRICVCSLTYLARNAQAPYCHLSPLRLCYIFPHYFANGTIFENKLLNIKCVFWFSLQHLSETFLILRRFEREMIKKCTLVFI
jgi:hypothetical protein